MASRSFVGPQSGIPPEGLTVLWVPETEPSVDIVFVHGFTGHPYHTWRKTGVQGLQADVGDVAEPPRKLQRLLHRSTARESHSVYWPTDLLPNTISDARIMTYGYDTHIRHKLIGHRPSQNTVHDIASNFLVALEAKRRDAIDKPLIFVAHSLGGIVVKEMLRRSQGHASHSHLRQIASATNGMVFFGTPHSGADPRGPLLHAIELIASILGVTVNQTVVDTLLPGAELLRQLSVEFPVMAQREGWSIHSFQEQLGVRSLGGKKVVEDTSSCLHSPLIEVTEHIANDHMDMCRFSGPLDMEYGKVAAALERLVQRGRRADNTRGGAPDPALPGTDAQRCKEVVESLAFEQMGDRQMGIKRAHRKTCRWFLTQPEYINWQDETKMKETNGVLWIKGKAGTGKSTLMKYLLDGAKKGLGGSRVVSFFFHARGGELEKSTTGMYRHLIIQMLGNMTDNDLAAIWRHFIEDSGLAGPVASPRWTVDLLKDFFRAAVLTPGRRLACFIDALDECDEGEIRDMLDFFTELGELSLSQGAPFQVCLSSRHYPHITVDKCLELNLDVQSGHERDIISYLETELKIGKSKAAKEIRSEMLKSASGIFMWVVLVTQILNREFDRGNIHALKKKLKEIPKDLNTLFESILTRDEDNKAQLLSCIQWTLYARRPLGPEELYFAIVPYDSEPDELAIRHQPWDPDEITGDQMERFIVSSSKGLVEVTSTKKPTVQFIHESIRDYLFQGGLEKVWPELKGDFSSVSHDALKNDCLSYIQQGAFEVEAGTSSTGGSDARSTAPDPPVETVGSASPSGDPETLPDSPREAEDSPTPRVERKNENPTKKSKGGSIHRDRLRRTFPFLQYALQNVIYHSDRAQQGGICQLQFLHDFPKHQWVELDNAVSAFKSRQHTAKVPLVYLLAEQNAANLIRASPDPLSFRNYRLAAGRQERYGAPLVAAIAHGSHEAIEQLLLSDADLSGLIEDSFITDTSAQPPKGRQNLQLKWVPGAPMASYLFQYGYAPFIKFLVSAAAKAMQLKVLDTVTVEASLLDTATLDLALSQPRQNGILKAMISGGACQLPRYTERLRRFIVDSFLTGDLSCLEGGLANGHDRPILPDGNIWTWTYKKKWEDGMERLAQDPCRLKQNLRLLVDAGYDVNASTPAGPSLLDELVWWHADASIASFLLERGAGLHIWAAAGLGDRDAVIRLLDSGFDINTQDHFGSSALWYAARNNHKDLVEMLLAERRADPNLVDQDGESLLHHMATFKSAVPLPILKVLIEHGANVNATNIEGKTPLHVHDNPDIIALLCNHGADVNVEDIRGKTPLHVHDNPDIIALLCDHDADVNAKDAKDETPLHVHDNPDIIALLCNHGADVNAKDVKDGTPLHVHKNLDTVVLLCNRGADVNAKDPYGRTPLHVHKNPDILALLCNRGAGVNVECDYFGHTPLFYAASEAAVEVLCKNGAELEARDNEGYTPLLYKVDRGQEEAIGALIEQGARKDARSNAGATAWDLISDLWSLDLRERLLELLGPEP
ncbi:hypothetical protein MAPG_04333 [Magnaporthiopsis poae ATCC 64411]|uniref:Nephrocystin 3-like N-terminal domain-containing protein n=1 Tax=Magnaporthiopsis poae (strain ATCC 64411 / 73-15) TaxID=644358 RepID=A0A0C4DWF7_MAGP6|nr:hypothetical protein MAPG_04333 [Magnaporthiopsis poae ATCC 64411]